LKNGLKFIYLLFWDASSSVSFIAAVLGLLLTKILLTSDVTWIVDEWVQRIPGSRQRDMCLDSSRFCASSDDNYHVFTRIFSFGCQQRQNEEKRV